MALMGHDWFPVRRGTDRMTALGRGSGRRHPQAEEGSLTLDLQPPDLVQ